MRHLSSIDVMGVSITPATISDLQGAIRDAIASNVRVIIANHNLHSVYLYHKHEDMRRFYELADVIHVDGMSLIAVGKLCGTTLRREHRVTYVDWIEVIARDAASNGWRVAYVGSAPGVAQRGVALLQRRFANLDMIAIDGYFDVDDDKVNARVIETLNAWRPHILMVGMGMPRQELWIRRNADVLGANAILAAGACMDYVSGAIPTAPRWMGQVGLEWMYRLASEPARLSKRYLLEPWALVPFIVTDLFHAARRSATYTGRGDVGR